MLFQDLVPTYFLSYNKKQTLKQKVAEEAAKKVAQGYSPDGIEYLTNLEITNLIRGLSPADILRLGQIAKKYVYRSLMDADEILSEAIVGRSR